MTELRLITCEPAGDTVIALLDKLMTMARDGKLSSIAVAMVDREGVTDTLWSEAPSFGTLLGATARLAYKLNQEIGA